MLASISTRQVALRQAAVAALTGLALVLVIELPWTLAQGRHLGVLCGAAIAACLVLAAALVTSRGDAAWCSVAAFGAAAIALWVATRAAVVPGLAAATGHWTTPPGLAACAMALGCIALAAAGAGVPPARAAAAATGVALALAPGAVALLVALGPGPSGGEQTIAAAGPGHVHSHGAPAAQGAFRPGFGGHAGHYVYPNATPPRLPSWGLALAVGFAVGFAYLAAGALRRRGPRAEAAIGGIGVPA
jgi:hypothetical protein